MLEEPPISGWGRAGSRGKRVGQEWDEVRPAALAGRRPRLPYGTTATSHPPCSGVRYHT
jgi:hypothetical protein